MRTRCTIFFLLILTSVAGQTVISGTVRDDRGDAVPLANVVLVGTYDGTTTDASGNFLFTTEETGNGVLVVKFIGYRDHQQAVNLDGKTVSVSVVLEESINELQAVTISAGTFAASDESRRTVFRALDIATTAGATADIAGALNTLPGTQKVGESGRLFVRGGDGSETRTFIDGMVVLDAYGPAAPNTPSRGRFLPFMFKGTSFSTGGYSAEYGQALSSALVLDSRDESPTDRTDIGLLSVGGDVAHTQSWTGGSASAKVQYTNLRPYTNVISQRLDWIEAPASVEGVAAVRQKLGKRGMLKVYGNANHADFSLFNHDLDNPENPFRYGLANDYRYVNSAYKTTIGKDWLVRGGVAYSKIKNDVSVREDRIIDREEGLHAKTVFEGNVHEQVELKSGLEVISREFTEHYNGQAIRGFQENIVSVFSESDVYFSNSLVARGGLRSEYNNLTGKLSIDPRLSLAYKTGSSSQVSLAYGQFRQSVKNEWLKFSPRLDNERAGHYILNYQLLRDNKTFRFETYYKSYRKLARYTNDNFSTLNNTGDGYAGGFELFWRDAESVRGIDYWLSYSYLDTKRLYLNFPVEATPSFASRHNFSAVAKYFIQEIKSQVGATYSFASGRPYHDPNGAGFNAMKTKSYQDLSFNLSYLPKPYIIIHFSCTNILGYENVFGYQFGSQRNSDGVFPSRPITQPAKRFVFLGIFITLSKEKTVNQLPTL